MPISTYYGGQGERVMASMRKTYGPEKAKRVFYATAHKRSQNPSSEPASMKSLMKRSR